MEKEKNRLHVDIEWKNRVLCSDESCIGIIGSDGRCKECGKIYEGHEDTFDNENPQDISEPDTKNDSREAEKEPIKTDISEWENRVLCSDASCIGVIGPDGRCKECGKIYEDK